MKKLIVLLLAFALVGAVSAQVVTTAVSLSGEVTLIDQNAKSVFTDYGTGYDVLTIKASDKDGKYGFAISDGNVIADLGGTVRDWNVWYKGAAGKVVLGNLRNSDFRMTLPAWGYAQFGGFDRITGYGVLYETPTVKNLTFGVNFPVPTTATNTVDVLKKADLAAKYSDKNFTWMVLANLDMVTPKNVVFGGASFTGYKDLTLTGLFKGAFDDNNYGFAGGVQYTGIDKFTFNVEGSYQTSGSIYDVWGQVAYAVTDLISAKVGYVTGNGTVSNDFYGAVGYDLGNGLSAEASVGYDTAVHAAAKLYYGVSF
ncbi:MAG TPA: hypothetical protein PLT87_00410 [Spirochaetales bacterium]|nr:hypothetical protein [Spirochaetales bacterium]